MAGDWSDVPYIQAASFGGARSRTPLIVIHATDNTASAYGEAVYASTRTDGTSAHFFVDATSIYQCVPLSNIAHTSLYHGNQISVQFELCGLSDHLTDAVIRNAARYVRRVCDRYAIPITKLSPAQVRDAYYSSTPPKGICGHADVTLAFPEDNGTHTDPGASFPWATFLGYVGGSMSNIVTSTDIVTAICDGTTSAGASNDGHSRPNNIGQARAEIATLGKKLDALTAAVAALSDDEANVTAAVTAVGQRESDLIASLRADLDDTRGQLLVALTQISGGTAPTPDGVVSDKELAAAYRAAAQVLDPAA